MRGFSRSESLTLLRQRCQVDEVEAARLMDRLVDGNAPAHSKPFPVLFCWRLTGMVCGLANAWWWRTLRRAWKPRMLLACRPWDLALARLPGIAGFFGASSIERLSTERAIRAQVEVFKNIRLA